MVRIALLLSALSAITISYAAPWNMTTAISSSISNISPYETLDSPPQIPVTMKRCTGHKLSEQNYLRAKEQMIEWSECRDGKIYPGSAHTESYPDKKSGATWYVCNCKWLYADKVPRWELDYAQQILETECGKWQSGWVWSKKWDKGYNVVPTEWFKAHEVIEQICPPHCFFWLPRVR
ncbi:hypothetical protein F5Y01DRAFT_273011 [Xylaria sp. FL0043]|nr:hypothetical protein F5Y01DRAFT_273011 [Xylaria sp. FL0043]